MKVIGVSGKAGHGKNECARIIKEYAERRGFRTLVWSLATVMKAQVLSENRGKFTYDEVFKTKPPVVRDRLQKRGTEEGRKIYGEDYWLVQVECFLKVFEENGIDLVLIPDVRFVNEVDFCLLGGRSPEGAMREISEMVKSNFEENSEDFEEYMIRTDTAGLIERDIIAHTAITLSYDMLRNAGLGACIRIVSDRPTLEEGAGHESETALDNYPLEDFSGVVINNQTTTLIELEAQLVPIVDSLLGE